MLQPPEPDLTPDQLIRRAIELRPLLRARQADCEAAGRVPEDVNAEIVRLGFYRTVQPRRFGGYEFDVPTFYQVMMELARGCSETGWVVALTAGHPILIASYSDEGQTEVYGTAGEFRCPAAFAPPGKAVPVEGGYRVTGSFVSASGCDIATHVTSGAIVEGTDRIIHFLLRRDQFDIVDDWQVMGMRGTGSKCVVTKDAFVPSSLTIAAAGPGRGAEPAVRPTGIHANPMYSGRVMPFLIGEAAAVAVGAARGALDHYEEMMATKKTLYPPFKERSHDPEYQRYYGEALALISTAEAALIQAGRDYMDYAQEQAAGGDAFDEAREQRLTLIEQHCVRMAWNAVELIYRTAGTSAAAKSGQPIGRVFRNMAVLNTHPALQMDRIQYKAAKTRFGISD